MSQQKVDRYKKQKNDREKIQRREKWELRLEKLAIARGMYRHGGLDRLFRL